MASDNLMTWDGCTLFALAESPVKEGVLWSGSNDGIVTVTQDGGKNWTNVTSNITGLPKWGTIRNIDASNFDAGTCYISVDAHHVGDFGSYVFKTSDFGKSWIRIPIKLTASNSNFVNQIKEDPAKKGLLWLGTDKSLYFSPDDGMNWIQLNNNLPPVPIYGIEIQKEFNDLVVATYGRGIYILDDITPIREFSQQIQNTEAHLFSLRKTYRFQNINGIKTEDSYVSGENPPDGADINYYLKEKSKDSVTVLVLNSKNETVKTIKGNNKPGINRVWWNLRHQDFELPKLLNKPKGKEWVTVDSLGARPLFIFDLDIGPGLTPVMVPPGNYTIVLKVNGKEYRQSLSLVKDPSTKAKETDIQNQYAQGINLFTAVNKSLHLIDEMEKLRAQLVVLSKDKKKSARSLALEEKVYALEGGLFDVHQTGARMDIFRNAPQVLERLLAMGKEGIVSSADSPPTDQQREVYELTVKELDAIEAQFELLKKSPEVKQKD